MTSRLVHLLRHGAPETPGLLMGRTDGVPTAAGIAVCVAQAADLPFDQIVSSGLLRTHRAAEAIGAGRAMSVRIDPRWRELDFGAWDGKATGEVDADALGRFWDDPDRHAPPQGERWSDLVARVGAALADCAAETTLVVTHGGAMRAALAHLCGFGQRECWAFDLSYGALLTLRIWDGEAPAAQIIGLWP
jgi:alpha-ribazole phosphatase